MSFPTTIYNHEEFIFGHLKYLISYPSSESASYDVSEIVGYDCSIELSRWSQGVSWKVDKKDHKWRTDFYDDPKINFSFLIYANSNKEWEKEISSTFIQSLLGFEKLHQISMYQVIWVLSRSRYATDLFLTSPLLFWIILDGLILHKIDPILILKEFKKRRCSVLKKLGYSCSKSTLKFINKITYKRMNRKTNQLIWSFLSHHDFHPLNHREHISINLIAFLIQNTSFISSKFVKTIEDNFNSAEYCQYIKDTISMSTMLGRNSMDSIKGINNCRSFCEIKRLHDRLSSKLDALMPDSDIIFEPTTLKGTKYIIPILSLLELRKEGMDMNHCIRSYEQVISEGKYAVFKVMKPDVNAGANPQLFAAGSWSIKMDQLPAH